MLCTTSAGTCARPREVIPFLLQSLNYAHCSFFFCTKLLKYIMITYTVRTAILHHPACHILCSLLSPHSYHLSVPSGIRSFYQWYGASALSSVKSRSRWEGWCWKDSRQGGRIQRLSNSITAKMGSSSGSVLIPFKHPPVLRLAVNPSKKTPTLTSNSHQNTDWCCTFPSSLTSTLFSHLSLLTLNFFLPLGGNSHGHEYVYFVLWQRNSLKQCWSLQQNIKAENFIQDSYPTKIKKLSRLSSVQICVLSHPDRLYPEIKLWGGNLLSGSGHILN